MNRRGFLGGLLALAAPAIVRTPGLLMPVREPRAGLALTIDEYAQRYLAPAAEALSTRLTGLPEGLMIGDVITWAWGDGRPSREFVVTSVHAGRATSLFPTVEIA